MKVMIAIPELGLGGPDRVMATVATALDERGWTVVIGVQRPGGPRERGLPASVRVERIETPARGLLSRQPVLGLRKLVAAEQPDVLLTTLRMVVTAGVAMAGFRNAPLSVTRPANHIESSAEEFSGDGLKYRVAYALERWAIRRSDSAVAQSADLAISIRKCGFRGPLTIIGNPIDEQPVEAPEVRLGGSPSIVAVGRLVRQKGFDLLLEALPQVLESMPSAQVHLVGDGPETGELADQAQRLGVQASIKFWGLQQDARSFIRSADMLVAPSRYEGFSNVILEAQAEGVPVVATDCPGAAKVVLSHTGGGCVIPVNNVDGLAAGILKIAGSLDSFNPPEIRGRTIERWGTNAIGTAYHELLRSSLATSKGSLNDESRHLL